MTCRAVADLLLDYVAGELSPEMLASFEAHLHRCPNCVQYLRLYRATIALSRVAFDDRWR